MSVGIPYKLKACTLTFHYVFDAYKQLLYVYL